MRSRHALWLQALLWLLDVPEASSAIAYWRAQGGVEKKFLAPTCNGPSRSSDRPGPSFPSTIWSSYTSRGLVPTPIFIFFTSHSLGEPLGLPSHHSLISFECYINTAHRFFARSSIQTLTLVGLQSSRSGTGDWTRPATDRRTVAVLNSEPFVISTTAFVPPSMCLLRT